MSAAVVLPANPPADADGELRRGVWLGVGAYVWWGLAPMYFKALGRVTPTEIVAHRVIWSAVLLLAVLAATKRLRALVSIASDLRTLGVLVATTALISSNWLVFVRAIEKQQVLQASLAYFITPLLNVLLGFLFLKERLRPLQRVSLGFAVIGVAWFTWRTGSVPAVSLFLATTFALYGFLRKTVKAGPLDGLAIETLLVTPLALGYVAWLTAQGRSAFFGPWAMDSILLASAGVMTAVPLLWFAGAARRLPLSTLGFLQYIGPSLQFLLAVWIFGEPFDTGRAVGFAIIWMGLAIYTWDAVSSARARGRSSAAVPIPE